jgi:hypothetical protein
MHKSIQLKEWNMLDLIKKMKKFFDINSSENTCHYATDDDSFEIEEEKDKEEENDIYLEWFDQFLNSSSFEKLTEEQKEKVDFILHCFDEYLEHVDASHPADWNTNNISELCLEVFPRKITAELALFKCIGPVLIAFFNFLAENKLLKQAWKLSTCIKTIQADIPKQAADSRNWGMAKTFAMKAIKEGVDLSDPAQNDKFIRQLNQDLNRTNNVIIIE